MVKKSTLTKKLTSYTALATVVLAAAKESDAQVVYTKIDTTITTNHSYHLDISGPGAVYNIKVGSVSSTNLKLNAASISGLGGDEVDKEPGTFAFPYAKANGYKNEIGSSDLWTVTAVLNIFSLNQSKNHGFIAGKGDKYIGLRSVNGSHVYWGWLRVNLNAKCDTLIIKSVGFNANYGGSITAGEGDPSPAGINQVTNTAAGLELLYPNPAFNMVNIVYTTYVPASVTLELFDITGHKIETLLNNVQQAPGRTRVPADVSNLSSGVYFYTLTVNGQTYTQRLVVAR